MKLALLIGINYNGTQNQLNGCINDATNLQKMLIDKYNYPLENITLMTDDTPIKPTGDNIIKHFYDLVLKTHLSNIEELWISYSGHGASVIDYSGDEKDGKDEVIIPLDYKNNGVVSDDLLNHILSLVSEKTKVVALFDCCHSGTILDLPYRYVAGDFSVKETEVNNVKADVVMISGCQDDQTSADAYIGSKYSGAMTESFLATMEKFQYDIPVFKLLKYMREYLVEHKFAQVPQITCTFEITHTTAFSISKKQHKRPFMEAQ